MKMNLIKLKGMSGFGVLAMIALAGCDSSSTSTKATEQDSFVTFALEEIDWLQKNQPGLRKTVSKGEDVTTETVDSLDWANELEWVTAWSLREAVKKTKYDETIDSAGDLKIVRYTAQDTAAELQELMVNYNKKRLQLMVWTVKQRSWYMDRDVQVSFQPRQGYGVSVKENALWSSPKSYEIFAEIGNR